MRISSGEFLLSFWQEAAIPRWNAVLKMREGDCYMLPGTRRSIEYMRAWPRPELARTSSLRNLCCIRSLLDLLIRHLYVFPRCGHGNFWKRLYDCWWNGTKHKSYFLEFSAIETSSSRRRHRRRRRRCRCHRRDGIITRTLT